MYHNVSDSQSWSGMNDILPLTHDANSHEASGSQVNFIGRFSLGDGQTNFGNLNR